MCQCIKGSHINACVYFLGCFASILLNNLKSIITDYNINCLPKCTLAN